MDTMFYIIALFSFSLGLLNLGGLFFLKNQLNDRGAWTLTIPLIPLLIITALLMTDYFLEYRYPDRIFTPVILLLEWSRISLAFIWNFITYYHYSLNGVEKLKRNRLYFIAGVSVVLCVISTLFLFVMPEYMPVVHITVIILLYHAGIRAVLILRKRKRLLQSTTTGLTVAAISLIVYPVIGIGDPLGWRIPFLNPAISLWIQGHPIYFTLINIPLSVFLVKGLRNTRANYPVDEHELEQMKLRLSEREKDVLELLVKGLTYQQISDSLYISLPTVKTHIQHIYYKLEVKRREELFIKFRK